MRLMFYVVPLALAIYALIDFSRSEPSERVGIRPLAWLALIVLLPVIGPITWIVVSRTLGRSTDAGKRSPRGPGPRAWPGRRPGPRAPDDDLDFLWRLEQQRRRARGKGSPAGEGTTGGGTPDGAQPGEGSPPDEAPEVT